MIKANTAGLGIRISLLVAACFLNLVASGDDTRAVIEILAAVTAKANHLAATTIAAWDAPDERKKDLFDHYAALKESMLQNLLDQDGAQQADA